MAGNRHMKRRVRARMKRTGETYCAALAAIRYLRANRECHACGELGHVKSHCPKKEKN